MLEDHEGDELKAYHISWTHNFQNPFLVKLNKEISEVVIILKNILVSNVSVYKAPVHDRQQSTGTKNMSALTTGTNKNVCANACMKKSNGHSLKGAKL